MASDGTLDWFCPDGVDLPPTCWSLLDPAGGAVRIGAAVGAASRRRAPSASLRYRPATNTVDIDTPGAGRHLRVTDVMPWPGPGATPTGRLVRIVTALAGPVEVEIEVRPPGPWGRSHPVSAFAEGLVAGRTVVRAGVPLEPVGQGRRGDELWRGVRRLAPGERMVVTVDRLDDDRHAPLSVDAALRLLNDTDLAWRSWSAPLAYTGPYRRAVERSVLAVRALSPSSGGPPLAAGTTSLGRRPGGERTEDSRVVRWRDAATAASVLARVGLHDDAIAAEEWLRRAAEGGSLPWAGALDRGARLPSEREELALAGWRRSQPVVTGRRDPRDADLYGDVVRAVSASTGGDNRSGAPGGRAAGPLTAAWPALVAATDWLTDHWADPDGGVWGMEGPPLCLSATRLQAWVAFDRMARLARSANPLDLDAAGWQQAASEVAAVLEGESLAEDGGLKLAADRGRSRAAGPADAADAALLRVAWSGPWPAHHPIVAATVDRILDRLATGPYLHRYPVEVDDGRGGPDAPDLLASLWAVRALAVLGRWEEAHDRMERLCALADPVGLLSETVDPLAGELHGNYPAAGVHLALIEAALALEAGPA